MMVTIDGMDAEDSIAKLLAKWTVDSNAHRSEARRLEQLTAAGTRLQSR